MLDFNLLGMGGLNPLQMAAKGYEQGANIQQDYLKQQALQQVAIEKKQNEIEEEAILAKALDGDIQAQAQYALKFAKNATEAQSSLGVLDKPKREARKTMAYQWDSLARTNPTALREILKQRVVALENGDPTPEAQQEIATIKSMQLLDDSKLPMATLPMIAVADPDGYKSYIDPIIKQQEQPLKMRDLGAKATIAEAEAKFAPKKQLVDIQNKQSEIERRLAQTNDENERRQLEAQKIELDRQKLYIQASQRENKPLSAGAQKIADQFSTDAVAAVNNAATARQLVSELKQIDPNMFERGAGWSGALSLTGGQYQEWLDSYSQMRKKIIGTNKDVVGGGVLSDSDMKLMREGIPEGTAEPKRVIKFMEDFAKVQDKVAVFDDMRANWMQQNGNMGKLKDPLELSNGDVVPAGSTVTEAARMFRSGKLGGSVESKTIVPVNDAISQLVAAGYTEQEARKLVGGK